MNLVGNALKYSHAGSEVRVAARAHGGELLVSIADRGPGVDPEDAPRLFDRYYRGQRTQGAEGLGLGLYIVQVLVQAHRGRVRVESRPGEGATFRLTLPPATAWARRSRRAYLASRSVPRPDLAPARPSTRTPAGLVRSALHGPCEARAPLPSLPAWTSRVHLG